MFGFDSVTKEWRVPVTWSRTAALSSLCASAAASASAAATLLGASARPSCDGDGDSRAAVTGGLGGTNPSGCGAAGPALTSAAESRECSDSAL